MSFDDNDKNHKTQGPAIKVKKIAGSMFDNMPKKPSFSDFEKNVSSIEKRKLDYSNRSVEAIKKISSILSDKTLVENKMPYNISLENEAVDLFIKLITDINTDENQVESEGSVMAIAFLLKIVLGQKDRINKLEYELINLSKSKKNE